jgi:hypothetical protein
MLGTVRALIPKYESAPEAIQIAFTTRVLQHETRNPKPEI